MRQVSVIVKATRLCNLRCSYCHDWRAGPGHTMAFPVLARTIRAALVEPDHDAVTFIWHGGEPSTLPPRWYARAMAVQARYARPGQVVQNVVQTNAVRVTDEWARFLKTNRISVGVSIDGPEELHDRRRVGPSGRGSFARVIRGLGVLRAHGVDTAVLMVVDNSVLEFGPAAVFDFMVEHGITSYGFNAVCPENVPDALPGTLAEPYVSPRRMNQFLAGLYDRWLAHGDRSIRIREIESLLARVSGRQASTCQLRGDCLGDYYIVEPDGEVAHCDLFLGDRDYVLGNVLTHGFAEMRAGAAMTALRERRRSELQGMSHCDEFAVCNGWCPHETYLSRRHDPDHSDGCCGLAELIGHIRDRLPTGEPPVLLPMPTRRVS